MSWRTFVPLGLCLSIVAVLRIPAVAQRAGAFMGSADDPAIRYSSSPLHNDVDDLNRKLREGGVRLASEGRSGYLRSALDALRIPVDSQLLVFSRTSLQGKRIGEQN